MSKTALLSIDVQQSFEHAPYWDATEYPAFQERFTRLAKGFEAAGQPIVRILHEGGTGAFAEANGWVKPMAWVPDNVAQTFIKHVHNAFTDTGLEAWLRERGIERVVVAGIRTEQCCETTTRVASDLGFQVDYVTEATLTFAMKHPTTGNVFTPAMIRERTELVLVNRFANIRTVEEVLASL